MRDVFQTLRGLKPQWTQCDPLQTIAVSSRKGT